MKKLVMISISCLMMLNTAYASDSMSCENLQVTIFNSTDKVCALKSYHMDHGYLVTPPPTSLMPNGVSNFFIMESQYFGPQIRLSYQCGEETISFISRQNYCFILPGDVAGYVLSPRPMHLKANYTGWPGNLIVEGDRYGHVNWLISA